ncbi:hypothetical protein QUV80_02080 [Paraclostridium benzoelyticum]|nr:hypothetical protein [Paraclostridium benzoelyticum]
MENRKSRGILADLILFFSFIGSLLGVIFGGLSIFFNSKLKELDPNLVINSNYAIAMTIFSIISIIIIIYVLFWNKIAIYGFALIALINYISSFVLKEYTLINCIVSTSIFTVSLYVVYSLLSKIKKIEEAENLVL